MRVFLTGANGWIGSAITRDLLQAGHIVVGLVRSKEKGEAFAAAGGTPLVGALSDLDVLRQGSGDADGVIHTAFGLDISKIDELAGEDNNAIDTFGEVFAGSDRPIIVTSGVFMTPPWEVFKEDARPPLTPGFPRVPKCEGLTIVDELPR